MLQGEWQTKERNFLPYRAPAVHWFPSRPFSENATGPLTCHSGEGGAFPQCHAKHHKAPRAIADKGASPNEEGPQAVTSVALTTPSACLVTYLFSSWLRMFLLRNTPASDSDALVAPTTCHEVLAGRLVYRHNANQSPCERCIQIFHLIVPYLSPL